jgi:peptide/nickel transport system permease protein
MSFVDPAFPSSDPFVVLDDDMTAAQSAALHKSGVRRFFANSSGLLGSLLLLVLVSAGLASSVISRWLLSDVPPIALLVPQYDPNTALRIALASSVQAILPSFTIGLLAGLATAALGLIIGGLSGYFGGWIDALLSLLMDFASALPFLPFAVAIIAATGAVQGVLGLVIIFSVLGWVGTARLVRAELLVLREQPFTEAAQSVGVGHLRILVRHLYPHLYPSVLIATVLSISSFMLAEATLDFLRIGVANTVTLGSILGNYDTQISVLGGADVPQILVPGVTLWLLVLAVHLIGQGMQQALDVQMRS